ncbi:MAG: tetratricopeptide repeat protein [Treponema sp.]|nr:tetratricopeptide repeat protein [Treponema sp.]
MRLLLILLSIITLTIFGCRDKTAQKPPLQVDSVPLEEKLLSDTDEETAQSADEESPAAAGVSDIRANSGKVVTGVQVSRSLNELSALLPTLGVSVAEINPVNYQKADAAVLRQMGMEQYLISFIAAERLYRDGSYRDALAEYSSSITLKSDYADALEGRGNVWLKTGETGRAIDDYTRAINLKASRAELYNYRGFAYAGRGETEKAIADFSQALRLKPGYADALANRSRAYYQLGDYGNAIDDCTLLISLEPENFAAWNRRGSSWYAKQDDNRAIADFSKAITIKPDFALALHNRGNAWHSKGDFTKALADLNSAITIDPGFTAAYASRDTVLRLLGSD